MERRSLVQCARLTKCSEWQLWRCRPAICRKKSGEKVQVLSLANSYTVKAGDVLVGIGGPSDRCIRFRLERYPYVARNVQITDGLTRSCMRISAATADGYLFINTAGEMVGWTSESCRSESCTDRTAAYTISSYSRFWSG